MVYVDELQQAGREMKCCHLFADTEAELEAFARQLGLHRKRKKTFAYVLWRRDRENAVRMGALPVGNEVYEEHKARHPRNVIGRPPAPARKRLSWQDSQFLDDGGVIWLPIPKSGR